MAAKNSTVLKNWSFLIYFILFGMLFLTLYGVPEYGVQGLLKGREKADFAVAAEEEGTVTAEQELLGEMAAAEAEESVWAEEAVQGEETAREEEIPAAEESQEEEPVFGTVEDDYFADAVFIGDSRTVGMYEYGGLEEISTFCCSTGLTVYKMFDARIVEVPGTKEKKTVEELLSDRQFSSIYLMIGINEMGTGTVETFMEAYKGCVEHLQELQPEAVIYLQGIIKVTVARSEQGDYINNEGIEARNEEIEKLSNGKDIFYLDVNPLFCDETGGLTEDYTYDGVHLKAKHIALWKDYLKTHVVVR